MLPMLCWICSVHERVEIEVSKRGTIRVVDERWL